MPLQIAELQSIHQEIRAYFRHGVKSSNKRYFPPRPGTTLPNPPGWRKVLVRNENCNAVHGAFGLQVATTYARTRLVASVAPTFAGSIVAHHNPQRFGNCIEMACMAAYLVMRRGRGQAWLARVTRPGDHAFCLVRGDQGLPTLTHLLACAAQTSGDWVIDPWANVCCPLNIYLFYLLCKFDKWTRQGKHVRFDAAPIAPSFVPPNNVDFRRAILLSPIEYVPAEPVTFAPPRAAL